MFRLAIVRECRSVREQAVIVRGIGTRKKRNTCTEWREDVRADCWLSDLTRYCLRCVGCGRCKVALLCVPEIWNAQNGRLASAEIGAQVLDQIGQGRPGFPTVHRSKWAVVVFLSGRFLLAGRKHSGRIWWELVLFRVCGWGG